MKVAVVGPTHPAKGGVAAHTTTLAHRLAGAGHDVTLVAWTHLYPSALYPGAPAVPDGEPDVAPYARTVRVLSWARPDSWVRAGRRLRGYDAVVVVHVVPAVVPAHLALLGGARGLGRGGSGGSGGGGRLGGGGPRIAVLAHNVLPHESHPGSRGLVATLLRRADAVLVHTVEQAETARELGAREVLVAAMPPHLPGGPPAPRAPYDGPTRLLALGMVRGYKGVDLAVRAAARVPTVTLTVAGELWGEAGRRVEALAADPALRGRVQVQPGYVPAGRLPQLLAEHDVLTLTYRSATASQNVLLAHAHGLPVLASDVGTFGEQVRDGVDGLLTPPGDEAALVAAVARLADRTFVDRLRSRVRPPDLDRPWIPYLQALEALMSQPPVDGQVAAPPGGTALAVAKRGAEYALWARVGVQRRLEAAVPALAPGRGDGGAEGGPEGRAAGGPEGGPEGGSAPPGERPLRRPVPVSVAPTGVLQSRRQWEAAVAEARWLRLPLHRDRPKNWDALGAVGALLRLAGDEPGAGRTARDLRVMDAGSARYSPVLPWLRLYGLGDEPGALLGINLEFGEPVTRDGVTFRYGDVTDTGLPEGGLDAVTCMSVIEHGVPVQPFLAESARVLRPGGVFCVSTDYDQEPPDTSGHTAYGGPVHIFGPGQIRALVDQARQVGLDLVGTLDAPGLRHPERPVHWRRLGLDYTFVLLTFRRR